MVFQAIVNGTHVEQETLAQWFDEFSDIFLRSAELVISEIDAISKDLATNKDQTAEKSKLEAIIEG